MPNKCILAILCLAFITGCSPASPVNTTNAAPKDLYYADYDSSGQLIGVFDGYGNPTDENHSLPVSLSATESPRLSNIDQIGILTSARYDPESGVLILTGRPINAGTGTSSSDFPVALRATLGNQDPGVSIDPGPNQTIQNVRYIGPTAGTHFGMVMFEADRVMKTLSLGQDNITNAPVSASVPGYQSMFDLGCQYRDLSAQESRHRFWIVVDEMTLGQTEDGLGIVFRDTRLRVNTEYLDENWQTLPNAPIDPASQAFADHLTQYYEQYSQEFPVFAELEALARWVALTRWLADMDIPGAEILASLEPAPYDTPETTPAITLTRACPNQGNSIYQIILWGGVDLAFDNRYEAATRDEQEQLSNPPENSAIATATAYSVGRTFRHALDLPDVQLMANTGERAYFFFHEDCVTNSNCWGLATPSLEVRQQDGEGDEERSPVWDNPTTGERYQFEYAGQVVGTEEQAYVNQEAGLVLTLDKDGYLLRWVTFQDDGSYTYDPGKYQEFTLDGNITSWAVSEIESFSYIYADGILQSITGLNGTISFTHASDNRIQEIVNQTDGTRYIFDYDSEYLLTTIRTGENVLAYRFAYDDRQRLIETQNGSGQVIAQYAFDDQGDILADATDERILVYDWGEPGSRIYRLGSGSHLWTEIFGAGELENIGAVMRLHDTSLDNTLYIRESGQTILILLNGQTYILPAGSIENPDQLKQALTAIVPDIGMGKRNAVFAGDGWQIDFQELFPESTWLRSQTLDVDQIEHNLADLPVDFVMQPENTTLFVGLPLPEQVEATGLPAESRDAWAGIRDLYVEIGRARNYAPIVPTSQQDIIAGMIDSLSNRESTLILTAHSDGLRIHLPDGTSISPADLSESDRATIQANRPIVVLLSCETARIIDSASIAKQFLYLGARMVVAPSDTIPSLRTSDFLDQLLRNSAHGMPFLDAFREALKEYYIPVHIYIGRVPNIPIPGGS